MAIANATAPPAIRAPTMLPLLLAAALTVVAGVAVVEVAVAAVAEVAELGAVVVEWTWVAVDDMTTLLETTGTVGVTDEMLERIEVAVLVEVVVSVL